MWWLAAPIQAVKRAMAQQTWPRRRIPRLGVDRDLAHEEGAAGRHGVVFMRQAFEGERHAAVAAGCDGGRGKRWCRLRRREAAAAARVCDWERRTGLIISFFS
jgi:hypothetical protein